MIGDIPVLKIEMENIRKSVMTHLAASNKEYNAMVLQAVEETLTEEWVEHEIKSAVNKVIKESVSGLSDNWELKYSIGRLLGKALSEMVDKTVNNQ